MKFSFNPSNNSKTVAQTKSFGSQYNQQPANYNLPGDAQYKFYTDLCKRKRVPVNPRESFTKQTISQVIDALQTQPDMISDRQLEKVASLYVELDALKVSFKRFTETELHTFSGGNGGKASRYIDHLMKKLNEAKANAPLTEEQLNVLVPWMLCPAVPFESITIPREEGSKVIELSRTKATGRTHAWSSDAPQQVEWTLLTPDEFAEQLQAKLTKADATYVIDQYRGLYYDWRKTRITQNQINHVRKIEQRMADMYTPKQVETAYDWETGEEITIKTVDSHVDRGESQYVGYTPIAEHELLQLSVQEASKYIDQLTWELECLKNGKMRQDAFGDDPEQTVNPDNQYITEKHSKFNERNHTGLATKDTKDLAEFTAFSDMLFALEAMRGHKDEVLHDLARTVLEINFEQDLNEQAEKDLSYIAQFMFDTVDTTRDAMYIFSRAEGLMTISENTVVGTIIAQGVVDTLTEIALEKMKNRA